MNTIWKIFTRDLKEISKNVMVIVVIIGISVIPALYAWFNIAAFWDPYANTKELKVAVVNLDQGYTVNKNNVLSLNVGDEIVSTLRGNDQIGWVFTDYDAAMESVRRGDIYAAIVIPQDFSQKTASILTEDIQHPKIEYYVNEKKNAIAPKITDQGISLIQEKVNSTFVKVATEAIASALNVSMKELNNLGVSPLDGFINILSDTNSDLQLLSQSIASTQSMIDAANSMISAIQDTLPNLTTTLKQGDTTIKDARTTISSVENLSDLTTEMLDNSLDSNIKLINSLDDLLDNLYENTGESTANIASQLQNLSEITLTIADSNQQAYTVLQGLMSILPAGSQMTSAWEKTAQDMKTMIADQKELGNNLADAADEVQTSGSLAKDSIKKTKKLLTQAKNNAKTLQSDYKNELQPAIETTLDSTNLTLADLSSFTEKLEKDTDSLDSTLSDIKSSLTSISSSLGTTKSSIDTISGKLQKIVDKLNSANGSDRINTLLEILHNNPDMLGDFVSSPVEIESTNIYPIKNYGSAMAPFFTMLSIWVGGIIMIALFKVRAKEDDTIKNIRPYQVYCGKFILFAAIGLIQATIVCLGDIFFMQIQCLHPMLFLFAGWVASLVFVLIIYTLTISFGNIGKAISVIILVISIAGSGGTFPIEMTPDFFQKMYPLLPLTYAINAMRAAVAGVYANDYLFNLLKVLLHVPPMLILGLVLRNPLIRLNQYLEERMKDSDIM